MTKARNISKLSAVEVNATADQTDAEVKAAVEAASDSNTFTDADHSKLNAIEASADVTDATNVTAAGALMDSELTNLAAVKAINQSLVTTAGPTFSAVTTTGNVIIGDSDSDNAHANADNLVIGTTSGSNGMTIVSPTDGTGSIHWSDGTGSGNANIQGQLIYAHNDNSMRFYTAVTEAMRIDSSGNVLVGKTSENTTTVGIQARADGLFTAVKSGAESAIFGRHSSDGNIVLLRKDGATKGMLGVNNGDPYLARNNGNGFRWYSGAVVPTNDSGNTADNAMDLGSSSGRFKDLHLSGTAFAYRMKAVTASSGGSAHANADEIVAESNNDAGISILSGQSYKGSLFFGDAGLNTDGRIEYSQGTRSMTLATAGSDAVTIDSSGNVGIGTTSPSAKLEITTADNTNTLALVSTDADAGAGPNLNFRRSSGSPADGDGTGAITWTNNNDAGEGTDFCRIDTWTPDVSNGTEDGEMNIRVMKDGTLRNRIGIYEGETVINQEALDVNFRVEGSGLVNLFKVDAGAGSGKVGINCDPTDLFYITGQATSTAMGIKIGTNGYNGIEFDNATGSLVGRITINSGTTAYVTSSDYRLKENVVDMTGATTRLKQLKPKRFNWIADDTNTLIDGFLAHEVSSIVPEAVAGEKDAVHPDGHHEAGEIDPQGIDHSKLVPLLVKTIQELEARITALEA